MFLASDLNHPMLKSQKSSNLCAYSCFWSQLQPKLSVFLLLDSTLVGSTQAPVLLCHRGFAFTPLTTHIPSTPVLLIVRHVPNANWSDLVFRN